MTDFAANSSQQFHSIFIEGEWNRKPLGATAPLDGHMWQFQGTPARLGSSQQLRPRLTRAREPAGDLIIFDRSPVLRSIEISLTLPEGWDGYGGRAPSVEAATAAKFFLLSLNPGVPNPEVEPSGDGEINLVWRDGPRYLEVGFYGDEGGFYGQVDGEPGTVILGDVTRKSNRLPVELVEFLNSVTNANVQLRAA